MKYLITIIFIAFFGFTLINNLPISAGQLNTKTENSSDIRKQIDNLRSEDPLARCEAVQKLSVIGIEAKSAIPELIKMLSDTSVIICHRDDKIISSSSVDKEALKVIINIGDLAVEPLINAVKSNNVDVRRNSIKALGKIKNSLAVDTLITSLKDEDTYVRKNSAEALGEIGDQRAVIPLISALDDKKTCVKDASLNSLKKVINLTKETKGVDSLSEFITHENKDVREIVVDAIKQEKDRRTAELLIIAMKDKNPDIRKKAIEAVRDIGKEAVEPLINALNNNDDIITKISSATILGELKEPQAVEPLINSLKYESKEEPLSAEKLKVETIIALGKIGDARAVEPLIQIINGKQVRLKESAMNALSEIGEPAVDSLISIIKSQNNFTAKINAVIILGNIKSTKAVEPIINTLLLDAYDNKSWMFRAEAIRALAKIGDQRAIEPLNIMLNDYVSYIRDLAQWAIKEIKIKSKTNK
ncbi:MAG: HEAT repeat domain-containing protein [Nitrospirae bacterium]|nr:HEAT repeat domain-containing protein [Nitrospirota bacterium]